MAIKPTIYKARIALSDLERHYYDTLNLTIAQHPSETIQRMVARILAYAVNAQERLIFCKGLSDVEEPALWVRSMDEQTELWIDVGEPAVDRIKKATRQAQQVKVYSFNTKSDVWWEQGKHKFSMLSAEFYRFDAASIETLSQYVERTMDWSITISGNSAYVATANGECDVIWEVLQNH